ncbi:MAG: hypothetical protein MZU97_24125 [Bacillus subtilis]|nr:hypothetical protein [Bacillus subtilis]
MNVTVNSVTFSGYYAQCGIANRPKRLPLIKSSSSSLNTATDLLVFLRSGHLSATAWTGV